MSWKIMPDVMGVCVCFTWSNTVGKYGEFNVKFPESC